MYIKSPLSRSICEESADFSPLVKPIVHLRTQLPALSLSDVLEPPRCNAFVCHAAALGANEVALPERRVRPYHKKDRALLAKEIVQWPVQCRLSSFSKLQALDALGEAFWGEFRQLNERLVSTVLPKCLVSERVYLKDTDLETLKRQKLKPELVSQFIYWLLVSPHGPECLISVRFDVANTLTKWLWALNISGAALFVRKSRFQLIGRVRVSEAILKSRPPLHIRRVGQETIHKMPEQSIAMDRGTTVKPIIN